jgi:site-specific recombinase XerD
MASPSSNRTKVFISYSHKDTKHLQRLQVHLADYVRQKLIDVWDDTRITPGANWRKEIEKAIESARVAVLLVSADFLASRFIAENELPPLLEAAEADGTIILPIILSPCGFRHSNLSQFQAVNSPSRPLTTMKSHQKEELWANLVEVIADAIRSQQSESTSVVNQHPSSITQATAQISSSSDDEKRKRQDHLSLDEQVSLWLDAKTAISNSKRTRKQYKVHIGDFRKVLQEHGLDLDCEDENTIIPLAEECAAYSKVGKEVSAHTYNQCRSILSSFYRFALKKRWIMKNPIEMMERREEPVSNVEPLDPQVVQDGFRLIDRSTLLGKRDYALFCVLFTTERLVSEVTELKCGDIAIGESEVTLTFQRVKGGKRIHQNLTSATASALLDYLNTVYGNEWPNDAPVWISDSRANKGDAIGTQAVNGRCEKYFGTSKLEVIRCTAAEMRKRIGAKDIENLLQIN